MTSKKEITASMETITPEIAKKYLATNPQNYRSMQRSWVRSYRDQLLDGHWEQNGEPIRFDSEGRLVDGQHRLTAILESGVTIPLMVMRNVDHTMNVDRGRSRTLSESLKRAGVKNAGQMATVYGNYLTLYHWMVEPETERGLIAITKALEFFERHDRGMQWANKVAYRAGTTFTKMRLAACIFMFAQYDRERCEEFIYSLENPHFLKPGDPILALIKAVQGQKTIMKGTVSIKWEIGIICKAIKFFLENRQSQRLSYQCFGVHADEFPVFVTEEFIEDARNGRQKAAHLPTEPAKDEAMLLMQELQFG